MIVEYGDKGHDVQILQIYLANRGLLRGKADGIYGPKTQAAVAAYQEQFWIYTTGQADEATIHSMGLADAIEAPETIDWEAVAAKGRKTKITVPADPVSRGRSKGLGRWNLYGDAGISYQAIKKAINDGGGRMGSAGASRSLFARSSKNRSSKSLHYYGGAADEATFDALYNPARDATLCVSVMVNRKKRTVHRVTHESELDDHKAHGTYGYWHCYCVGEPGAPGVVEMDLPCVYVKRKKVHIMHVRRHVIDQTQLFFDAGWAIIPARPWFFTRGERLASEWFHKQYEGNLVPYVTRFGEMLLTRFSLRQLKGSTQWMKRNAVFRINWNSYSLTSFSPEDW